MGFREDINMEEFIRTNEHLVDALSHAFSIPPMRTNVDSGYGAPRRTSSWDAPLYLSPTRSGQGSPTRSTCLAIESWPSIVWDVNGYYHALGVGFRATRKQLLRAYTQLNGQESEYLTYVFKQLLDPEIRRSYDSCPLGSLYVDKYVTEDLKRRAIIAAKRMSHAGCNVTAEQVLDAWGFQFESDEGDAPGEPESSEVENAPRVDTPQEGGEDERARSEIEPERWPYSYYVWKIRIRENDPSVHLPAMRLLQEAIVEEAQSRDQIVRFGVGVMGSQEHGHRIVTMSVDGAMVVFISAANIGDSGSIDDIDELAHIAVDRLTTIGI